MIMKNGLAHRTLLEFFEKHKKKNTFIYYFVKFSTYKKILYRNLQFTLIAVQCLCFQWLVSDCFGFILFIQN